MSQNPKTSRLFIRFLTGSVSLKLWHCPTCGAKNPDKYAKCWYCGGAK